MQRASLGFLLGMIILSGCTPATPTASPEPITVQYTFATATWLSNVNTCTGNNVVNPELRAADYLDVNAATLAIRLGQSSDMVSPAYQIGTEELLVIVNRQNPINRLTAAQVQGLFSGQIQSWQEINGPDAPVEVWVFPAGEDVQQIFEQAALAGAPVTSGARLANTPDEMSQAVAGNVNAVGVLPRHWKSGNVSDVFTVASVPVLVFVHSQPQGILAQIIACLQK